jgi:hypothetical protein
VNLNAAALKIMIAKGLTLEDVAEIVAANEVTRDPTAAERQARYRARKREGSQRNVTRDGSPNEYILTPSVTSPKPNGLAPSKKSNSIRGSRLPDDWTLPAEWADWAKERRGWSAGEIAEEATIFANYWQSKSGAGACHRDWFKTWKNWVIRSHRKDGSANIAKAEPTAADLEDRARKWEQIGRSDEAAECRRRATALGSVVNDIVKQVKAA